MASGRFDVVTGMCVSAAAAAALVLMVTLRLDFLNTRTARVGTLTTLGAESNAFGVVCTSAEVLIISNCATRSWPFISQPVRWKHDLGSTELTYPLGLALNDSQRVVYVAHPIDLQIKTVALPDRYFI